MSSHRSPLWLLPQGDYVLDREAWPGRGHYDVIMCLNVTKWVQLQSGDAGVGRLFKRAYQSLSPGGIFILEPQPWSSYCHSKRASVTPSNMNIIICSVREKQHLSFAHPSDTVWSMTAGSIHTYKDQILHVEITATGSDGAQHCVSITVRSFRVVIVS